MKNVANYNDYFDDLVKARKKSIKKKPVKGCPGNEFGPHVYFVTRTHYFNQMSGRTWKSTNSFCLGCEKRQRINFNLDGLHIDEQKFFHITGRDSARFVWIGKYITRSKFDALTKKDEN